MPSEREYLHRSANLVSPNAFGPELPTVHRLMEAARDSGLVIPSTVKLIAVQHMVRTNLTLFHALFTLGLQPRNTFVIGKGYSTSLSCLRTLRGTGVRVVKDLKPPQPGDYGEAREEDLRAFWRSVDGRGILQRQEKMLIADIGGRLLSLVEDECADFNEKREVIGIEQTTSGIRRLEVRPRAFPVVNVAQAAAKPLHESRLVAQTIIDRVDQRRPGCWPHMRIGVVGMGEIGRAMITALVARGFEVMGADPEDRSRFSSALRPTPLASLVERSEIIFGCTGRDIFQKGLPIRHQPNLVLVSCSSEDEEFRSLLRQANSRGPQEWPAPDVTILGPSGPVTILAGGYPINFDTSGLSVPEQAIQATTALMLAGVLTAASMISDQLKNYPCAFVQLPLSLQAAILEHWRQLSAADWAFSKETNAIASLEYLAEHSAGRALDNQTIFSRTAALMRTRSASVV
jgi:hypothetical protein